MPTDEVSQDDSAAKPRTRTGPRHAAPKKPLSTRFHVPAGKAVAFAAMPTAVLMGIGFTPTLANADDQPSTSKSLTAEEYQACVELLDGEDASASPTPSASASASASESADETEPSPSATPSSDAGETPSSDSGSDDEVAPTPSASASKTAESNGSEAGAATPTPSESESSSNPLDPLGIGDAIKDILTPDEPESATPAPSATPSATATEDTSGSSDTAPDTAEKPDEPTKDTTDTSASKTAEDSAEASKEPADEATSSASPSSSPSPSASASTDAADCPVSTDAEGNVDNPVILPDDPWYLNASSLLLKGADYQGVVEVKTANGTVKKVLKYVISGGTDIGDLHQTVIDKRAGKTYHVQAGKGTTSTITDGDTVMYTESISGKLFGLIPITFDPEHPPPLNIPLIYFTDVKVTQAGQFGGTLTIPSMHTYQD
ncbi:hypothetical protein [Streptomyces sp. NPDC127595]|uniref:hypothetical protein n=1 Tax=Streptomyces sp. NPDC127595 TaxID=3345405 RepID=UPI00363B8AAF